MSFGNTQTRERVGRPTQFHSVSVEERAFDASGNRLPWALEFPDGHPNARLARKQPEEKGSFGRSARRTKTGSTRGATRTQTPATREINSSLKGFEQALQFEHEHAPQPKSTTASSSDPSSAAGAPDSASAPAAKSGSEDAVPTQLILHGFAPDSQWSAVGFYEKASAGMICEEYDRDPPDERKRWHGGGLVTQGAGGRARRALTPQEARLSMQYRGGAHWVRVTLDSAAAAERALAASPHLLLGHWVYAVPWRGAAPERDEPLPMRDEDRVGAGVLAAPSPQVAPRGARRPSMVGQVPLSPLSPREPGTPWRRESSQADAEESPGSSATASSGTATGPELAAGELRQRSMLGASLVGGALEEEELTLDDLKSASLSRFPQQGRLAMKPVSDALLPSKSWSEKVWKWLTDIGLVPKDIIGSTVPRLDNGAGEFDWDRASYYWRLVKWLDDTLGTDLCGMKDV